MFSVVDTRKPHYGCATKPSSYRISGSLILDDDIGIVSRIISSRFEN